MLAELLLTGRHEYQQEDLNEVQVQGIVRCADVWYIQLR